MARLRLNNLRVFLGKQRVSKGQIIVSGVGRSGTTAVVRSIGQHPNVLVVPGMEMPYLVHFVEYLAQIGDGTYAASIFNKFRFDYIKVFGLNYARTLEEEFIFRYSNRKADFWIGKSLVSEDFHIDTYRKLFSNPKFVIVFRNGIEVVASRMKYMDESFETACSKWSSIASRQAKFQDSSQLLAIQHVDVIRNPEGTLKSILEYVNLPFRTEPADFIKKNVLHPTVGVDGDAMNVNATERSVKSFGGVNVREYFSNREPIYISWNEEQRRMFKDICGESMDQLGYEMPF